MFFVNLYLHIWVILPTDAAYEQFIRGRISASHREDILVGDGLDLVLGEDFLEELDV